MISERKINANRANAQASTGPKTARGKTRAAKNARRHGLSLSILADPACSAEVEGLAHEIAGTNGNPEILGLARHIAEAHFDLMRIRRARHDLLVRDLNDPNCVLIGPPKAPKNRRSIIRKFFAALKRKEGPIPEWPENLFDLPDIIKLEGVQKFAIVTSRLSDRLIAMDRYERRALSRRKFAIRELDAIRRQAAA